MPKIVDHDQRRASVIAATRSVVSREGVGAATMRRIAEEAGCSTGRITHYFDDKHEVLVAVLEEVHQAAAARMLAARSTTAPSEALRAVLAEALPLDAARLEEWRVWLAFWGRAAASEALRAEQHRRYRDWSGLLADLLATTRDDPWVDLIVAAVDGIGLRAALDPDEFPPQRQLLLLDRQLEALAGQRP